MFDMAETVLAEGIEGRRGCLEDFVLYDLEEYVHILRVRAQSR